MTEQRPDNEKRAISQLKLLGYIVGALSILISILNVVAAPLFQPLVYDLVMQSPVIIFYWVPTIVLAIAATIGGNYLGYDKASTYALYGGAAILVFSLLVVAPLSVYAQQQHLADRTQDKMTTQSLYTNNSSTLPELDSDNHRNVPLTKAKKDASNNFQQSKHKLSSDADITYVNGEPYWSWAAVPDSGGEKWSGAQNGAVFVSQSNSDGETYVVEGDVKNGQGVKFWRSHKWNLQRNNYWVDYQDNTFMSVESLPNEPGVVQGKTSIATPVVSHEYHFKWGIIPYTVPSYDGVALQDSNGNVEQLSPSEVQDHPQLKDDNVYPYWLTRTEISALNWEDGVINKFWNKNDLFKFAEPNGDSSNQPPYTMQGADGSKQYYIPTSPQGSGEGLKDIFIQNGQTGEFTRYKAPQGMVGPQNVGGYIQGESTPPGVTNWDEYNVVEILPVTHNGELYYQGHIVKSGGPGMPGYAFVNANNPDDIVFVTGDNKDTLASQFIDGQSINDSMTVERENETTANGTTITYVVVYNSDGEELGRYKASDVNIEFEQERTATNATTANTTAAAGT